MSARRVARAWTAAVVALGVLTAVPAAADAGLSTADSSGAGSELVAFARFDRGIGGFALWTARSDGSGQRRLTAGQATFPSWSPDRSRLLFDFPDDEGNLQIASVRRDGTGLRALTDLPGISETAEYTPDGRHIVFGRSPSLPSDDPSLPGFFTSLWVMRANGSNPRPLFAPDPAKFDVEPDISPDGQWVAFLRLRIAADGSQKAALFVVGIDGTGEKRLTPYREGLEHPQWAPDGGRLIFNVAIEDDPDDPRDGIWLVGADGTGLQQLLGSTRRLLFFKPDFSPDGTRILTGCFARASGQDDLCVLGADGTGLHRITFTRAFENFPIWR